MTEVLAIVPARSGSKGIPHKNVRLLDGKPLLAHSIEQGLQASLVDRVLVSTDSPEYAHIAQQYGAAVPFLRPAEFAQDLSTDLEVFTHALTWLRENENYEPAICVHLRPTYPLRDVDDIDRIIQILLDDPSLDSVRSIAPAPETPFKMWFRSESGRLSPVVTGESPESHSLPRQMLPPTFLQNACIDAVRSRVILELESMTGRHVYGYLMDHNYDIDTELQFEANRAAVAVGEDDDLQALVVQLRDQLAAGNEKTFCFDIDGIVANLAPDGNYELATPRSETVQAISTLYDVGCRIILFTARGYVTGLDWRTTTAEQMKQWGVKYHELLFGKPAADYYVDDKMISVKQIVDLVSFL